MAKKDPSDLTEARVREIAREEIAQHEKELDNAKYSGLFRILEKKALVDAAMAIRSLRENKKEE